MPERQHITTGLDCWCQPHVEAYGEQHVRKGTVKNAKKARGKKRK